MSQFRRIAISMSGCAELSVLLAVVALGGCNAGTNGNLLADMKFAQAEAAPPPPRALMRPQDPARKSGEPLVILGPAPDAPASPDKIASAAPAPQVAAAPAAQLAAAPSPTPDPKPAPNPKSALDPKPAPDPYALKRVPLAPG